MTEDAQALVAYRWFQLRDDGLLTGAQNVVWQPGQPLHAEHISASLFERPDSQHREPRGVAPLLSVLWSALRPAERVGAAVVVTALVVASVAPAGRPAMGGAAASAGAVCWQVFHKRRALNDAVLRVCAVLLGFFALALVATVVWLIVLFVIYTEAGRGRGLDTAKLGIIAASAVLCAASAAALGALVAMYVRPMRSPKHDCPARPRRFLARWVPECGIHGYRTLELAGRAASRERIALHPIVLARVALWGRVFPYSEGFRSEWGRIDTLFDDGSGQVEVAAARYGTDVEALPAGVPKPWAGRIPAQSRHAATALRAWAARRQHRHSR